MSEGFSSRPPQGAPRAKLPTDRPGKTRRFCIPRVEADGSPHHDGPLRFYVTVSTYDDGSPGEIFIRADRAGSLERGALDAFAIAASLALQYGCPLGALATKLIGMTFPPNGMTGDPEYPNAASALDLVGRWLKTEFGPKEE